MRIFLALLIGCSTVFAQQDSATAIELRIRGLRSLDDVTRAKANRELALQIRNVQGPTQMVLASELANLATEGDFGRDTLQTVTATLDASVKAYPPNRAKDGPNYVYFQLARLFQYEKMTVNLQHPQYTEALAALKKEDEERNLANFTLTDLNGTKWTLKDLRGKVVLVNFWATWCPPCRKEMPDLDALHRRFKDKGLVILAMSDEEVGIVKPFIATQQKVSYPILLDPGGKVADQFHVSGIPKTFIYNREGKLAAQSIDMRTMDQFLALLKTAGME